MRRLDEVVRGHERYIDAQLRRNDIEIARGQARFVSPHELEIRAPSGELRRVRGEHVVLAVGSRPREPQGVPVDHEHILDSDSILSMTYLPRSLAILGGGVVASEYASIFAEMGVHITLIHNGDCILPFVDPECRERLVESLAMQDVDFVGNRSVATTPPPRSDGRRVELTLDDGRVLSWSRRYRARQRSEFEV